MRNPLRVCYPFVGDTVGGSHISALTLIQSLPRDAICPVVVVHKEGPLIKFLRRLPLGFQQMSIARTVGSGPMAMQVAEVLRCAVPLALFLYQQRIDIVHTNDTRMHKTWGLAARLAGAKFVWHQRNPINYRWFALFSWPANRVLTISKFCRDTFPPRTKTRVNVILNPFQLTNTPYDRVSQKVRLLKALRTSPDTSVIGYVGNMMSRKRPHVFVEMAARLCESINRPLIFPMFGEPRQPMRSQVEELVQQRGMRGRCIIMGPRFPIEPWIAGCDVLVAPALDEGFGRTLVEAMLVGTPVVAAAHGGHLEIIQDGQTGLLANPDDPGALADAVARLLDNPGLKRSVASAALRTATVTYSVHQHVKAILSVYREVMREPARSSVDS